MNNGLDVDVDFIDLGREEVIFDLVDWVKFKVLSLCNVVFIVLYMYDGCFQMLEEVIDYYNEGIKQLLMVDLMVENMWEMGLFLMV